jgi:hypothetical protein
MPRLRPYTLLLATGIFFMLLVGAIYSLGSGGGFMFDDFPNIVDNSGVQPKHADIPSLLNAALASPASDFKRPAASLSFALNFLATGLDPAAMKITNIALHLANSWLLYLLMTAIFRALRGAPDNHDRMTALLIAAGWALLPINLTAVLYVVQRMESMANLAVLAGLLGYVTGRRHMLEGQRGMFVAFGSILAGTALGALSKETAVMTPLYALLIEVYVFRGRKPPQATAPGVDRRLVGFYIVTLLLPLLAGLAWLGPSLLNPTTWARRDFTLATRLLSEARIVVDYIGWTITPTPHALSFYHDDFQISQGLISPWTTLSSALLLFALIAGALMLHRRAPLVGLGIALYLGCHMLTGTVLPLELVYEHRNYFASIGLVIALVTFLRGTATRDFFVGASPQKPALPIVRSALLVILFVWWAALTAMTARAWNDPLSLARELAFRAPDSPRAQYELGRTYIIYSKYDKSSPFVRMAYAPLEKAASLPGTTILPEQAMIFMNAKMNMPIQDAWWDSLIAKLRRSPATVQDESALDSLSKCVSTMGCKLSTQRLVDAFLAAVAHPSPSPRLLAMYANFAWSVLGDRTLAIAMQRKAVEASPTEMAYRTGLARMALQTGDLGTARDQVAVMQAANVGGRFDDDITPLEVSIQNALAPSASSATPTTPPHE